jgi:DNA relaxase NicK
VLPKLAGEFVGGGIDYLTITTRMGHGLHAARDFAFRMASKEFAANMFGSPWRGSGYEGFKVGHLMFGERADGCIIRLGSELAAEHFVDAMRVCDNVTRVDLQGTWRVTEKPAVVIRRHYKELKRANAGKKKAPAVSMLLGHDGGVTVYSGRRSSDVYARIYDKGIQSKQDQWSNCVRYELEVKGRRSMLLSLHLVDQASHATVIPNMVLSFLEARGCALKGLQLNDRGTMLFNSLPCPRRMTDCDRSLLWLRKQVRPTVIALLERGLSSLVTDALTIHYPAKSDAVKTESDMVH